MKSAPRPNAIAENVGVVLLFLFGTTSIVQGNIIPTSSMEPTLLVGDHVLVDKAVFAPEDPLLGDLMPYREIERGDIVVFRFPLDPTEYYVKRAIGLPGDRVRIEDKQVWVNNRALSEPYKQHLSPYRAAYRDDFPAPPPAGSRPEALEMLRHVNGGELVVPPGRYFVLGDNRDHSDDSRFWGFVPRENIAGTPFLIYWSYDASTEQLLDRFSPRHIGDLALNFFGKTRWERTFDRVLR